MLLWEISLWIASQPKHTVTLTLLRNLQQIKHLKLFTSTNDLQQHGSIAFFLNISHCTLTCIFILSCFHRLTFFIPIYKVRAWDKATVYLVIPAGCSISWGIRTCASCLYSYHATKNRTDLSKNTWSTLQDPFQDPQRFSFFIFEVKTCNVFSEVNWWGSEKGQNWNVSNPLLLIETSCCSPTLITCTSESDLTDHPKNKRYTSLFESFSLVYDQSDGSVLLLF